MLPLRGPYPVCIFPLAVNLQLFVKSVNNLDLTGFEKQGREYLKQNHFIDQTYKIKDHHVNQYFTR